MRTLAFHAVALAALALAHTAGAQNAHPTRPVLMGSGADDHLRARQLARNGEVSARLFRSASTEATHPRSDSSTASATIVPVLPALRYTYNSDLPYSLNDGALWAGRGGNLSVVAGFRASWGPVRVLLLPEFAGSENRSYRGPDSLLFPPIGGVRHHFSSPWHYAQSMDLPWRHGDRPFGDLTWGQSSIAADFGPLTVGASTENEWWGPGLRNALILSNNAPGFPKIFLRTARPIETRFGDFEGRWLSGRITQSKYFNVFPRRDHNAIALLALTWRPPNSNLFLGGSRAVWTNEPDGQRRLLGRALMVFNDVGQPNAWPFVDAQAFPGPDQLFSLFWRYVLPDDGFEFWGEWGRNEFPVSLRDFLVHPNHTQGYTLGLQWLGDPLWRDLRLRTQAEATYLEQSTTFRQRLIGSWYTSRAVDEGYTHRGQVLGAAIGPGSSSQFVALGAWADKWNADLYVTRIRWLEDARSQIHPYPGYIGQGERGACEHDVSFLPGIRGAASTPYGTFQLDYSFGWRLNVFFTHPSPCWQPRVGHRDVHNKSLTLTFSPVRF